MARKFTASKEQLRPDARFGSKLVSKFVNCLMYDGKKSVALAVFYDAMRADGFTPKPEELRILQESGRFHPELSLLASGAFAAGTLAAAAVEFELTDY